MTLSLGGRTVYRIGEALLSAGISRATYFRWIKEGRVPDARFRDRNGRRVLTKDEVNGLKRVAKRLVESTPRLPFRKNA